MSLDTAAKAIASKVSGLAPEQVERAVAEYRKAAEKLHREPEWVALTHICGHSESHAAYGAKNAESQVMMHVNSWKCRDEWKQETIFQIFGKTYETYGEARAVELTQLAQFKPYGVSA